MARRSAPVPIWSNILLRTVLYYAILGVLLYWLKGLSVGGLPLDDDTASMITGVGKKAAARGLPVETGSASLHVLIAMTSALLFSIPVAWIYTLTHKKKGWKQGTVQSLVILPVVIAGIVVLLKYSLALAFGMAAIVAAVRFKSALNDTRDSAFMLCGIGMGLSAGVVPEIAGVLSFVFSAVVVGMWYADFGRAPAALEGKLAEATLERALEHASRTGTFVARMDDEVFKSLAPDQLEAIADRAWRRRKRNAPDLADDDRRRAVGDLSLGGVDPDVGGDLRPMSVGEVLIECDNLAQEVHIGGQGGKRSVQEEHVLHEQHQHLGKAGPVVEQLARQVSELAQQVFGPHRGRIHRRLVEAEIGDYGAKICVGGEGSQVSQGFELEHRVVEGSGHQQPEKR